MSSLTLIPNRVLSQAAIDFGICDRDDFNVRQLPGGNSYYEFQDPEDRERTIAELEERETDFTSYQKWSPKLCDPPAYNPSPFHKETQWKAIQKRYEEWTKQSRLRIYADSAGSGKTDNSTLSAAQLGRPHFVGFQHHAKAREFVTDELHEGYFHLKGPSQPLHDCCMDAKVESTDAPECDTHGRVNDAPLMCSMHDLPKDDPRRQQYGILAEVVGRRAAHEMLGLHDCDWLAQFENIGEKERIAGVHEYQLMKSLHGSHDIIIDETPRLLATTETWSTNELLRAQQYLETIVGEIAEDVLRNPDLVKVVAEVLDEVTDAGAVSDGNIPHIESDVKLWPGDLAKLKILYNETLIDLLEDDLFGWQDVPLCFDAILALLAEVGVAPGTAYRAIASSATLHTCPLCGEVTDGPLSTRHCPECHWSIRSNSIRSSEHARAMVWADNGTLRYRALPLPSELPDSPLILDATATPAKIAGFYGVSVEDIEVEGDAPREMMAYTTQIIDGQYHANTIENTPGLQDRLQRAIDAIERKHSKPLFVLKKSFIKDGTFEFSEQSEVKNYGGTRGLNFNDCDAVCCIGAWHPNMDALERDAQLLTMNRADLFIGGEEHSTRPDAPNPPIYRKLNYRDEDGNGLKIPTKHYSGLVGNLFREYHEKEFVQCAHRTRPLIAEEVKHIYLLSNAPTPLPIDEVVSLDELAPSLRSLLPKEKPIQLLDATVELVDEIEGGEVGFEHHVVVADGSVSATKRGFHEIAEKVGVMGYNDSAVTYETVTEWVEELANLGLLTGGDYIHRQGSEFTASLATLEFALLVLSNSANLKVDATREFKQRTAAADGSLDWLYWAEEAFEIPSDSSMSSML